MNLKQLAENRIEMSWIVCMFFSGSDTTDDLFSVEGLHHLSFENSETGSSLKAT